MKDFRYLIKHRCGHARQTLSSTQLSKKAIGLFARTPCFECEKRIRQQAEDEYTRSAQIELNRAAREEMRILLERVNKLLSRLKNLEKKFATLFGDGDYE